MRDRNWAAGLVAAAALGCLAAAPASPPPTPPEPAPAAAQPPARPSYQPVAFGRLVADLPAGAQWQDLETGFLCIRHGGRTSDGSRVDLKIPSASRVFAREMADAGLKASGDDLFGQAATDPPDLVISGVVTQMHEEICVPLIYQPTYQKGSLSMLVQWRLYSKSQNRVLATVTTSANQTVDARPDGAAVMVSDAFSEAVSRMAAAPVMRQALRVDVGAAAAQTELPVARPAIALAGSLAAQPSGLSSAVSSVVLVEIPGAFGSGFLVSKDGYLLTDAHVVGDKKTVKVRWSDGAEGEAQVVRVDKGRDVALLKTDPRGHAPLALRPALPDVGETVFAIGAPLDQTLQGTVMRGVVSAHRVQDGYEMIQSDVSTNHGMSGGPLLDGQGRVVALVESGLSESRTGDDNLSINFFTPVGDALKYLSATPQ